MRILVEITLQQVIKDRHSAISCFFLLISGNPVWWNISVHRSQTKERRTPRCSKHFSQNLDTQKWSNNPSNVFSLQTTVSFFSRQTTESLNKSAAWKCLLKFSKVSNGGPSWVGSFLIDSWQQGTRDGRWSLKFSWESNPCKVYIWDRNRSFIQAAGPPKQELMGLGCTGFGHWPYMMFFLLSDPLRSVFCLVRWIEIENWWLFFGWRSTLDGNSPSNSSFISLNYLIALLEELDGTAVNLHESVWIPSGGPKIWWSTMKGCRETGCK